MKKYGFTPLEIKSTRRPSKNGLSLQPEADPPRAEAGFTLIELLVVIAIIGVIAAFLVPVFGRARENARRAACTSNLRQIGMAFHMYIDDNDFKLPPYWKSSTDFWGTRINGYMDDENVWHCPNFKDSKLEDGSTSYGYNIFGLNDQEGGWEWSGKDISQVKYPSQCIMIADSGPYNGGESPGCSVISRNYQAMPVGDRHSGGANVLFVDGHVGWYLKDFLDSADAGTWWNY